MERIDERRALELLIDVVDAYGEGTVYEKVRLTVNDEIVDDYGIGCRYQYKQQPSCLVGHVIHRAGVPMSTLEAMDVNGVAANELTSYPTGVTVNGASVLNAAQIAQDQGKTWGEALENARKQYDRILKRSAENV